MYLEKIQLLAWPLLDCMGHFGFGIRHGLYFIINKILNLINTKELATLMYAFAIIDYIRNTIKNVTVYIHAVDMDIVGQKKKLGRE